MAADRRREDLRELETEWYRMTAHGCMLVLLLIFVSTRSLFGQGAVPGEDCNANGVVDVQEIPALQFRVSAKFEPSSQRTLIGLAPADMDKDGRPDVIVTTDREVVVFYGRGDATFHGGRSIPSPGIGPVTVADFDENGYPDLAVLDTTAGPESVIILLDTEDGSLQESESIGTGSDVILIVSADLNGDGHADVGTLGRRNSSLSIHLGNGDGTFQDLVTVALAAGARDVRARDLDGDGSDDLVTATFDVISIILNVTEDSERTVQTIPMDGAFKLVIEDVDNDNFPDILVFSFETGVFTTFFGDGSGGFGSSVEAFAGLEDIGTIVSGDFTRDGVVDIVAVGFINTATLLIGNGDGTFSRGESFGAGNLPRAAGAADLDGDGILDLAVANRTSLSIIRGLGGGTFLSEFRFSVDEEPVGIVSADFDGDTVNDLATVNFDGDNVSVLMGNGDGTFRNRIDIPTGRSHGQLVVGDFDGDLLVDIASSSFNTIRVLRNLGQHDFEVGGEISARRAGLLTTADLDGDGASDFLFPSGDENFAILLSLRDGTFMEAQFSSEFGRVTDLAVADFDKNDVMDLALLHPLEQEVEILNGNGDGTFTTHSRHAALGPDFANRLLVDDLNGDGLVDMIAGEIGVGLYAVLVGQEGLTFHSRETILAPSARRLVVADFDRDGVVDVATAFGNSVCIFPGRGDGSFNAQTRLAVGECTEALCAGNFDGDGTPDIATANDESDDIAVLLNLAPEPISPDCNGNGIPDDCDIAHGASPDLDGNSIPDHCEGAQPVILDCNGNGVFDVQDIAVGTSVDVDENGVPDECQPDCDSNDVPDGFEVSTGASQDCNGNDVPDGCDIASGLSQDVNGDDIPDSCERDCDLNGLPDSFEMGMDPALDCNGNGILDTCDLDAVFLMRSARTFSVAQVVSTVVADINHDGIIDLVGVGPSGFQPGMVHSALGVGDGTFHMKRAFPTGGSFSASVAVADFDADGHPDVATANTDSEDFSVLLGKGDGTFGPARTYIGERFIGRLQARDMNGDQILDLIAQKETSYLLVLYGNGDGSFRARIKIQLTDFMRDFVIEDFNGDGSLDFSAVGTGCLVSAPGIGGGRYGPLLHTETLVQVSRLTAADLDMDGNLDLVGVTETGIVALRGHGDLTFAAPLRQNFGLLTGNTTAIVQDFGGDGIPDLALSEFERRGEVAMFTGLGTLVFEFERRFLGSGALPIPETSDLDQDGDADLIFGNYAVLLNEGDGAFPELTKIDVRSCSPRAVTVGEFNGDDQLDIALGCDSRRVVVLLSTATGPAGSYAAQHIFDATTAFAIENADMDGDGPLDLVTASAAGQLSVLFGNGQGSFGNEVRLSPGREPAALLVEDFDGDGVLDLVSGSESDGGGAIFLGNGDRTFVEVSHFATDWSPGLLDATDFNGDGVLDIVAGDVGFNSIGSNDPEAGVVLILLGRGDGTFQDPAAFLGSVRYQLSSVDLSGDGVVDVVATSVERLSVFLGNGDGSLQPVATYAVGNAPHTFVTEDLNADGILDVVTANRSSGDVSVLLGKGGGTLEDAIHIPVPDEALSIISADFNLDGNVDLAVTDPQSRQVTILTGNGEGAFPNQLRWTTADPTFLIANADLDADDDQDIVALANLRGQVAILLNDSSDPVSQDENLDGIIDECEPGPQTPGDCTQDGTLDMSDGICILRTLFLGDPPFLPCGNGLATHESNIALLDWQPDGDVDISDAVSIFRFLYMGMDPPMFTGAGDDGCMPILRCPDNPGCQ